MPVPGLPAERGENGAQPTDGKHKKTGRTFLCVPPVLHLRSHSLIPVIHYFSDCSLIFMSYLFQIVVWIEPI